jgi:large subunit ribosomal protein L25
VAHVISIREEAAPAADAAVAAPGTAEPEVAKKGKPEDAAKAADAKKPAAKPAAKK